jgi:hypothetical protein
MTLAHIPVSNIPLPFTPSASAPESHPRRRVWLCLWRVSSPGITMAAAELRDKTSNWLLQRHQVTRLFQMWQTPRFPAGSSSFPREWICIPPDTSLPRMNSNSRMRLSLKLRLWFPVFSPAEKSFPRHSTHQRTLCHTDSHPALTSTRQTGTSRWSR